MHKIIEKFVVSELLGDKRLRAKDVIVWLQLYRRRIDGVNGHARALNMHRATLRRAVERLRDFEWVDTLKVAGERSFVVVPTMPADVERIAVRELERVRAEVIFAGEWLMKCILDLIVADHDFRDNARPRWLVSGDGSGRLELDRWYRSGGVAIEFNGSQHYHADSPLHEHPSQFHQQMLRDNIKAGLCVRRGIRYVEIPARELSFEGVAAKVEGSLPLRPIQLDRPLFRTVAHMCHSYVNAIVREDRKGQPTRS